MGTEPESVDAQNGTMKDVFARCLKKNIAQVCTLAKSCAYRKEEFQFIANLLQVLLENWHPNNHSSYGANVYVNLFVTANTLFVVSLYKYVM
jgi:hypothetical protein